MADPRPSRRQAAMQGEQLSRVMLGSDSSSSSDDESSEPQQPTSKEDPPKQEEERDFWVETWWFDRGKQGFTRGRSAKYSSKMVESAHALRAAAQHMWHQPGMLVRFVITKYENNVFSYEIPGQAASLKKVKDAVAKHFAMLRDDPDTAFSRKLHIIFHEPGESGAVRDVIKQVGFPMCMEPS